MKGAGVGGTGVGRIICAEAQAAVAATNRAEVFMMLESKRRTEKEGCRKKLFVRGS
jgi:hypothetical protein